MDAVWRTMPNALRGDLAPIRAFPCGIFIAILVLRKTLGGKRMARAMLSVAILIAGFGVSQAQTDNCYPRIGAFSGQYEGQCPNSKMKWTVFENTVGAFGRNCTDEPWTYNRTEKSFYNGRTNETVAMQDCYSPAREQISDSRRTTVGSDAVLRFQEGGARGHVTIQR
jgi:hypothetical protein